MDIDENKNTNMAQPESSTETEDDTVVEEFVFDEDGEADMKATLKKIRKDLKESKAKEMEYLTGLQRERADFMNYKKDEAQRSERFSSLTKGRFAEELFPVLDAYDMAFQNKEAWEKVEKNWRMGVEYIHQQLLKVLSENGVEEIGVKEGDQFDPNIHQSVETIPTEDATQDHTIAKILQKGYKTAAGILRPARVNVFAVKE